jgi:hypothetical protein
VTFVSWQKMRGVRILSFFPQVSAICVSSFFKTTDRDLIFAEESGHARFESFASS